MMKRSQETDAVVHVPPGGPPQGAGPSREIFSRMGEEKIYLMCAAFYRELEKSPVRPLFPEDMPAASRHIAAFFIQLCGGPPLFNQTRGQPMMRARHLNFAIDESARQIWLGCFRKVLENAPHDFNFPAEHLPGFLRFLEEFSAWMVNRKG